MKNRRLIDSFNYAVAGIISALRTEKNMKIHFVAAFFILFLSLFFNFSRIEMLILFFTISLVIITEMINTAIERTIDLYTKNYHPLAKIVKDISAGAVLIASINSLIVAYLLFFDRISPYSSILVYKIRNSPIHLTFISIILVIILTISIKTKKHSGTPFKGGIVSGHSAIAFATATAITFMTKNTLVTTLSYLMALLVAESRIEAKIHFFSEVCSGAILGTLITILIFQVIG